MRCDAQTRTCCCISPGVNFFRMGNLPCGVLEVSVSIDLQARLLTRSIHWGLKGCMTHFLFSRMAPVPAARPICDNGNLIQHVQRAICSMIRSGCSSGFSCHAYAISLWSSTFQQDDAILAIWMAHACIPPPGTHHQLLVQQLVPICQPVCMLSGCNGQLCASRLISFPCSGFLGMCTSRVFELQGRAHQCWTCSVPLIDPCSDCL